MPITEILSPVAGLVRTISALFGRGPEKPMKSLEAHLIERGIVAEIPSYIPLQIVDSDGNRHQGVYVAMLLLWNRGKLPITRDDVLPSAPLQIRVDASASVVHVRPIALEEDTEVQVQSKDANTLQISFDCINPGEYLVLPVFLTGNPRPTISVVGRIVGQEGALDHTASEVRAGMGERFAAAVFLLVALDTVIAPPVVVWYVHTVVGWSRFFNDLEAMSPWLTGPLAVALTVYLNAAAAAVARWVERRKYPDGFPLRFDLEPTLRENLKGMWHTLLRGRKQRISASIFDWGRPVAMPDRRIRRRTVDDWIA